MSELNIVKELLKTETEIEEFVMNNPYKIIATVIPILHNEGKIILQFNGWSVNLYENGTWIWETTDGG
jgi:hypothetical protein